MKAWKDESALLEQVLQLRAKSDEEVEPFASYPVIAKFLKCPLQ